jgi:chaperone modulatory protein CbpM
MQIVNFITVNEFCSNWNIEVSFIKSLQENGLIEIVTISEIAYIKISQLRQLEKMVSFHYELDINLEGIETIEHLLQRINSMQQEIKDLRNKLRLFEKSET